MTALTGRKMSTDDHFHISRFPVECTEEVTRKSRGESWAEPCDKVAVAARFDPTFGDVYPVCARHARGEMVTLADLLGLWDHLGGTEASP